jgi:sugar diacid utilization regulator
MNGFNSARTAEALYIHRNSLINRLKKIEELMRQIHVLADRNGLTTADLQDMLELTKE